MPPRRGGGLERGFLFVKSTLLLINLLSASPLSIPFCSSARSMSWCSALLSEALHVDAERAIDLFYSTKTYRLLTDPKSELQLMSDKYILEDVLAELNNV